MNDLSERLYVATIAGDAGEVISRNNLGVEIDEFCTASNMDAPDFHVHDIQALQQCRSAESRIFHAPFNELHPCAVDPKARALARERFEQSYALCRRYRIHRMVVHSGFLPHVYFNEWFRDRSVEFWQAFMADKPDHFHLMIENVLDEDPALLAETVRLIGDGRVGLCLDVGHANVISPIPVRRWIDVVSPCLTHVHIHNNDGVHDLHAALNEGTLPMAEILRHISTAAPAATFTLETMHAGPSVRWLVENGFLKGNG